jgi:phage baseplate assembly protein W
MRFRRKSVQQTFVNPGDFRNNSGNKYIGITLPFNNPNGIFFQSTTNINQVYSNLKNLLMTAKGERYMLPEFGTEIKYILFENITDEDTFIEEIKTDISNALKMWLPYLVIEELTVNINISNDGRVDDTSHAVGIKLTVRIDKTQIYLPIKILISVTGNITLEAIYNGTG